MAKNLGGAIIDLLESERVELRAAAITVLAAVGKGDKAVETGLAGRLADGDAVVRRIALEALADMGTSGIAPRLIPLLRGDDETLAERAGQLLAQHGAGAEAALRQCLAEQGVAAVAIEGGLARFECERGRKMALLTALAGLGAAITDIEVHEPTLEDVFLGYAEQLP
ncbi:MAG TPA: HEAT repeat domain-containing protein [Azonexus sp.]|nr:HEAT repeat domain-containing protein [Azonexus sp.]